MTFNEYFGIRSRPGPRHSDKRSGTPTTGREQRPDGNDVPTGVEPTAEYAPIPVNPYRGIETHGVESRPAQQMPQVYEPVDIPKWTEPEPDPDPLPVRIVQAEADEIRSWSVGQITVDANPSEIVGRNRNRSKITIRNLDNLTTLYVSPPFRTSTMGGWPIDPGQTLTLETVDAIHGMTTGEIIYVGILEEFRVFPI